MRTKVSIPDSLELALEMRKKEKLTLCAFFHKTKRAGMVQAYLIASMDALGLDG